MVIIYHNPQCSKSCSCLLELRNISQEIKIINYLETPLNKSELITLINALDIKPIGLIRQKEQVWIEKFKDKNLSDGKIIDVLVEYPELMERPIVLKDNKAVIARPLEKAFEIL